MCIEVRCPNGTVVSTVGELKAALNIDMVHAEMWPLLPPPEITDYWCLCQIDWQATLGPMGLECKRSPDGLDPHEIVEKEGWL